MNKIIEYIESRPALNKSALAKEIGVSPQFLNDVLKGNKTLTDTFAEKIEEVLVFYGYQKSN